MVSLVTETSLFGTKNDLNIEHNFKSVSITVAYLLFNSGTYLCPLKHVTWLSN